MKKNKDKKNILVKAIEPIITTIKENKVFYSAALVAFVVLLLATYFTFISGQNFSLDALKDFEIGKVASKDVIASRNITYIDEKATELKRLERKKSVLPVFNFDTQITSKVLADINSFTESFSDSAEFEDSNAFFAAVQNSFPNQFSARDLKAVFDENYNEKVSIVSSLSKQIMDLGIIIKPKDGELSGYESDEVELVTKIANSQQFSTVKIDRFLTIEEIPNYINDILKGINKQHLAKDVRILMQAFLRANILYDKIATEHKLELAMSEVVPVTVVIPEGEAIVREGFIVTEENYEKLQRLSRESFYFDQKLIIAWTLLLMGIFMLAGFLFSKSVLGETLSLKNRLMLLASIVLIYLFSLWLSKLSIINNQIELISLLPLSLFVMLIAILISKRVAVLHALVLSLAILIPVDFNLAIILYVLFSSLAGVAFIHVSDKRIDLIKTAMELMIVNPILAFCVIMLFAENVSLLSILFGTAINGFMTGIFILGFLPILESVLNIPTNFRLMELSDLNSDILKRMLLTVPGTYNHSILLANLAEAACRKIGANPLLARVGAYYHDIGKMENPEYFVENQTSSYNKHNELNPRLSATVIRSHTKLGIAKGRELHLPEEVINMIASHHGDSVIAFFYHKAKELEGENVSKADFSYPGPRPKTKEASIVMLADVVEAACRAKIAKEKVNNLEAFFTETIDSLVKKKIEADQLSDSDLTLGEITIVKRSFVEILTGYYHSRIDYPSEKKDKEENKSNELNEYDEGDEEESQLKETQNFISKNETPKEGSSKLKAETKKPVKTGAKSSSAKTKAETKNKTASEKKVDENGK